MVERGGDRLNSVSVYIIQDRCEFVTKSCNWTNQWLFSFILLVSSFLFYSVVLNSEFQSVYFILVY